MIQFTRDMEVAMINPNGRISKKRTVSLMIALTILAWATQTLLHQWGFGAELPTANGENAASVDGAARGFASDEKFVPSTAMSRGGATLELRAEATVAGTEIKLRQIARWTDADNATLAPLADLIVARIEGNSPFRGVSVEEIKSILHDAGVNLAAINFAGAVSCTVNRGDVQYDERVALQQWIDARSGKSPDNTESQPTTAPATEPAAIPASEKTAPPKTGVGADRSPYKTLRDMLIEDLADRLHIPGDTLQVNFRPQDDKILALAEPTFRFQIDPVRVRNLGTVEWALVIVTDSGNQKLKLTATARAWQNQLVLARPLSYKQVIQPTDVTERRVLVDLLTDETMVTREQAVGQQAGRELKSGTILTARMIDPVQLVKSGQFVTITLKSGAVQLKTVARALEGGSFGQTIKVKNETTKDILDVVLTGPQTGTMNGTPDVVK
jgi:flagella basal body P-ring formation protein FlgA